ncbi:MAG TPA: hypothetical protein PLI16_00945 [Bacteroidales bacterium]|nr:hypothetical protein [Bacteroidales bacterium]HNZ43229.1 hypothetical protein [Bacteroidales bacterium]HOH83155.1 hypothetical protein [Bacteroidales bacterium]HPB25941.1 hypothetical protein [Bacteroidales bacterium]HPI30771.1 hypothetical protein [Bacteroidales bacterium]
MAKTVQPSMAKKIIFASIIFLTAICSCHNKKPVPAENNSSPAPTQKEIAVNKDSLLLELTDQILAALEAKDYPKISSYFHPVYGVRFSPYAYIDTLADVRLKKETFNELVKKQTKLRWGSFNGSGEDIFMTVPQYFGRFVYNANYKKDGEKYVNKVNGKGNTKNNMNVIYQGLDFIECYIPGFDKKMDGMDWCSLRLVFKKYHEQYFLVGIVHDQWTI